MMIVSLCSLFVNPLPAAQSPAVGGRSSGSGFLDLGVQKSTAYKAPGATIARLPATWVSPEIDRLLFRPPPGWSQPAHRSTPRLACGSRGTGEVGLRYKGGNSGSAPRALRSHSRTRAGTPPRI